MKVYLLVLTSSIKPRNWLFHVVFMTMAKMTKMKNARAGRTKLLFFPTKDHVTRGNFSCNSQRNDDE